MSDLISAANLAHHLNASSLNYEDWTIDDVQHWLDEYLKLTQYQEKFSKLPHNLLISYLIIDSCE